VEGSDAPLKKEAGMDAKVMSIEGRAVLVTGANRGIGRALAEEALRRGAKHVYARTRQPFAHPDERVTPIPLDVTNAAQIRATVARVESLDLLINNAGIHQFDDLLGDEGEARVRQAYPGTTWERLAQIKGRYDPTNLFRLNQNVPTHRPTGGG
jgi:NAD(P)-dependent dehydrogenase (short-subunit alcohol dehydrogenase family)